MSTGEVTLKAGKFSTSKGWATLYKKQNKEQSQCSTKSIHHLLLHRSQIDTTSSSAWDSQHHAAYEVCVVIVIGHDSGKPSETALPFSVLRKLFQIVFELKGIDGEEVGLVEHDLQGVLVWVDYTSVVCKMVQDALGHSATCQSLLNLPKSKQQVLTLASYAYKLLHSSFEGNSWLINLSFSIVRVQKGKTHFCLSKNKQILIRPSLGLSWICGRGIEICS